jgi:dihydrofolate synthase / folylpolyglutamate synthase
VDLGEALKWLDGHQNLERMLADSRLAVPTLERIRKLMDISGDPQRQYPIIHLTGTNGKTSTARITSQLLAAKGLSVGTFTSPHLQHINERIAANGEPISDEALAEELSAVAVLEPLTGEHLSWFDILTGVAYRWFADVPVHAAVVEVGLGGLWDSTNIADGEVAVVTNVGMDHIEFLGPNQEDIAREKSGIVKPGSTLILGETRPHLAQIFRDAGPAATWERGVDFACVRNQLAVGGRVLDIRTPGATYDGVFLALHGAHQGENFACGLAAAEAFFGAPIESDLVAEAAATVRAPGKVEVVAREPLMILDGVKNPEGAKAGMAAIDEEFAGVASRILVVGLLRTHDPKEMLEALDVRRARVLVACPAPSPRTYPPEELAAAAADLGIQVLVADSVADAIELAREAAAKEDLILVTGSLYVVGAAREVLGLSG